MSKQCIDLTITASAFPERKKKKKPGLFLWEPPSSGETTKMIPQHRELTSPKMPQTGSSAALLGKGAAPVCEEGLPGGVRPRGDAESGAGPTPSAQSHRGLSAASPSEIHGDPHPGGQGRGAGD